MTTDEPKRKKIPRLLGMQMRRQTIGYLVAAGGFVAGLAWNDAAKALIEHLFPLANQTVLAKIIYAAIVTIVIVAVTTPLLLLSGDKDSEK